MNPFTLFIGALVLGLIGYHIKEYSWCGVGLGLMWMGLASMPSS